MTPTATATLATRSPGTLLARLRAALAGRETALEDTADAVVCRTPLGHLRLRPERAGLALTLAAESPFALYRLRDTLLHQLDALDPALADGLAWQGGVAAAGLPPNVRLIELQERTRLGASFLRLRFAGDDLGEFARSGLHVRLLLPPPGRDPVWPRIGPGGRTLWPEGADALHNPAYTIRRIDAAAGWLDIDVVLHQGGRTAAWAHAAAPGARIGMIGPGGGWLPAGRRLLLGGDETALPAIARILEAAPPETQGTALVEVARRDDIRPLRHPPGLAPRWLVRGRDAPLVAAYAALCPTDGAAWFAAETAQAAEVRTLLRGHGRPPRGQRCVAAYWTA